MSNHTVSLQISMRCINTGGHTVVSTKTACNVVRGHQCFGGTYAARLQGKMEAGLI